MKLFNIIIMGALMSIFLTACAGNSGSSELATEKDLMHHRYEVIALNNEPIKLQNDVASELSFGEGMHISGKACNRFNGQAEIKNGILKGPRVASTMMFCAEDSLNAMENALFKMLETGAEVRIEGDKLFLSDGKNTISFVRRDLVQ